MARIWLRATGGKDRHMRYYSLSFFLPLFPPVCELTHLWCWPKKARKKNHIRPLSAAYPIISLSLSLALQLREGSPRASPRWSSLNTSHTLDSFLFWPKSCSDLPCSCRAAVTPLYSTTHSKTIDEGTLNVTPLPPGREADLKNWWSISLGLKTTDL